MKIQHLWSIVVLSITMLSCSDAPLPTSRTDRYDRDFVKQFGEFQGENWNQATRTAIRIKTDRPTPVRVFGDVQGVRYVFALYGQCDGVTTIPMSIPTGIKELIVEANGQEYPCALGGTLDLTAKSSRADANHYPVPRSFFSYSVGPDSRAQELCIRGTALKDNVFNFQENHSVCPGTTIDQYLEYWNSTNSPSFDYYCRYIQNAKTTYRFIKVYPLYWKENRYGESDYMIGMCLYNPNSQQDYYLIDFDDFDIKENMKFYSNFVFNRYAEVYTDLVAVPSDGKEAYDISTIAAKDSKTSPGNCLITNGINCTTSLEGIDPAEAGNYHMCFYVKSGVNKDGTKDERFGWPSEHISFQFGIFNQKHWPEGSMRDVKLSDIKSSYCGAITRNGGLLDVSNTYPYFTSTGNEADDDYYFGILGFQSQPDGVDRDGDFCDLVLGVSMGNGTDKGCGTAGDNGYPVRAYPWTLAVEDLGSTNDWDFNDLVVSIFDIATDYSHEYVSQHQNMSYRAVPALPARKLIVVPRAAGGTLPIYLMYNGPVRLSVSSTSYLSRYYKPFEDGTWMIGTEMHHWLGSSEMKPINVGGTTVAMGRAAVFDVPIDPDGKLDVMVNLPATLGEENSTIRNFWVLVDPTDELKLYEMAKFDTTLDADAYLDDDSNTFASTEGLGDKFFNKAKVLNADRYDWDNPYMAFDGGKLGNAYSVHPPSHDSSAGSAPQMLMCHGIWRWPLESTDISTAYSAFSDWVSGKNVFWHDAVDYVTDAGEVYTYDNAKVFDPKFRLVSAEY